MNVSCNNKHISQLFNQHGQLYNYVEFIQHYGIPISPKDFSLVFDAVLSGIISLFKGFKGNGNHPIQLDATETTVGKICFSWQTKNKKNKAIHQLFQQETLGKEFGHCHISSFFD